MPPNRLLILVSLVSVSLLAAQAGAQDRKQDHTPPTVEGLVVKPGQVPVPRVGDGAPLLTPEELNRVKDVARRDWRIARDDRRQCNPTEFFTSSHVTLATLYSDEEGAQKRLADAAGAAAKATTAAETARSGAAQGKVGKAGLEAAELARQAAINAYFDARTAAREASARTSDMQSMIRGGLPIEAGRAYVAARADQRKAEGDFDVVPVPTEFEDLEVVDIQSTILANDVVRVTGRIENPRSSSVRIPPLSLTVMDSRGGALATQIADPMAAGRIEARGSQPFHYDITQVSQNAAYVVVTFGQSSKALWRYPVSMFCPTERSRGRVAGGLTAEDRARAQRMGITYASDKPGRW